LLQLRRDELIGKKIDGFIDSSDLESFFQSLDNTHQKREIKLIDAGKNTIHAKLHIADIEYISSNDKLIIVNDITELKTQEDKLRAKNQELEHLNEELKNTNEELMRIFDNSTNPIALINKDGFLSYANEAFYKISGYLHSDLSNLNIMKLIRKEFKKQFFAKLEKADAIGFAEEFSAIIFSNSANSIHTKISLTKFSKDSFVMMLRDITAELMHTQNLEKMIQDEIEKSTESELKFATLFDNAPAGILILDENHCIVKTNKAFEGITGYKKDRLEGRKIEEFFLDEYKEQIINTLKQSGSKHDARASYEWKLIDSRGHTKDINALLELVERKDESFRLMIATDITELKKAREKEKQQEKLLIQQSRFAVMGEMINMIAHQWRQPLGALSIEIINLVDHLESEPSDSDYLKKWEKKSTSILKHLSHTIDEFRTFFKQDKKKEVFNLAESIENSIDLIVATLRFRNIEVIKELDSDIEIFGFQNKLQQAFLNILNNAKDAILENEMEEGKIVVLAKKDGDMVHISFEDNAGGIPVTPISKIFEPYFSTKSKNSSGIGLYMTKVIIDSHMGGELKVSNSKIGAKFDIHLPIFKDEGEHDS
jgi:PAS domain S-box-containing protein